GPLADGAAGDEGRVGLNDDTVICSVHEWRDRSAGRQQAWRPLEEHPSDRLIVRFHRTLGARSGVGDATVVLVTRGPRGAVVVDDLNEVSHGHGREQADVSGPIAGPVEVRHELAWLAEWKIDPSNPPPRCLQRHLERGKG